MAGTHSSSLAILLLSAATIWTAQAFLGNTPTLTTTLGNVVGSEQEDFLQTVQTFYGIPYAKPPVGDLRFRAPQPADPWSPQTLNGRIKPNACWQSIDNSFDRFEGVEAWNPNTDRNEDCLYLNVWRRAPKAGDAPKTIMVWIYGSLVWSGSAVLDVYDATDLAARKDVIVVTIAYRMGPLGFMYLENIPEVSGNAGLFDQVMALQWVKDNAVNLGGSPDDITIFGQSSGAVSVGFHMLSPMSEDLFNKAIMQSGSPTAEWAVMDTQKIVDRVAKLAANVSCPISLGDQLLPCLRLVKAQYLTDQQWILVENWFDIPIGPIVDGTFLPDSPWEILKSGNVLAKKAIIGVNSFEGIIPVVYGFKDDFLLRKKGRVGRDTFRSMVLTIANNNTDLQTQLLKVYSREFPDANMRRMRILDAASGDYLIKCPVVDFTRAYTELGGQVYLYSFEEKFTTNPWPGWMGVPHRYETEAVFGVPLNPGSINKQGDKDLTKEVMEFWTSFAKQGYPEYRDVEWPAYTTRYEDFVKIRVKDTRVVRRPRMQACAVWAQQ